MEEFRIDVATRKDRFASFLAWAKENLDTLEWHWEVRGNNSTRNTREYAYFTTNPPNDQALKYSADKQHFAWKGLYMHRGS